MILVISSPEPADRMRLLGFPAAYLQTTRARDALLAAQCIIRTGRPLNAQTLVKEAGLTVLLGLPLLGPEVEPKLECILDTIRARYTGFAPMEEPWKIKLKTLDRSVPDA